MVASRIKMLAVAATEFRIPTLVLKKMAASKIQKSAAGAADVRVFSFSILKYLL